MSLDFYLEGPAEEFVEVHECRECDHQHEYRRMRAPQFFSANITHNCAEMATAAGIYDALWHPENLPVQPVLAKHIVPLLQVGIDSMRENPARFEALQVEHWGAYKDFLPWLDTVLVACKQYPEAFVRASV